MQHVNIPKKAALEGLSGVHDNDLGTHIHSLRKSRHLTLEALSIASGVSRAALSKIERGEMSPTYDSLCKIARGFDLDIVQLLNSNWTSNNPDYAVTRKNEGTPYTTKQYRHTLGHQGFNNAKMRAFHTHVSARSVKEYVAPDTHDTEDIITVLTGRIQITLAGSDSIILDQGDMIHMDSNITHAIISIQPDQDMDKFDDAQIFWVSLKNE